MRFGLLSDIGEITPNIFAKLDRLSRAKIFIALYNSGVESELKIPLSYAKFLNFKEIFEARINFLLRGKCLNFKPADRFCFSSNIIINAYLKGDFSKIKFIAKEPKMAAAKMIKMLYASGEFELCIDAAQMFCQFVYDKIRLRHQDKEVVLNGGVISVKKDGKNLLSVMPSFKKVSFDDMRNLNDDIDRAVGVLGHECEMVYIVFPRNEEFRRHVEVRHCCTRGLIKLVPYTIISKIF